MILNMLPILLSLSCVLPQVIRMVQPLDSYIYIYMKNSVNKRLVVYSREYSYL